MNKSEEILHKNIEQISNCGMSIEDLAKTLQELKLNRPILKNRSKYHK